MTASFQGRGFVGNRPVDFHGQVSPSGGVVNTPGPGRASGTNQRMAHQIQAGLGAWDFDPNRVAGWLLGMPEALQKRLAALAFALVQSWADSACISDGYGPTHPMYEENRIARKMIHGVIRD